MFWCFGPETCGSLAPPPGIQPPPPTLEGEVLATGQPGESLLEVPFNQDVVPFLPPPVDRP